MQHLTKRETTQTAKQQQQDSSSSHHHHHEQEHHSTVLAPPVLTNTHTPDSSNDRWRIVQGNSNKAKDNNNDISRVSNNLSPPPPHLMGQTKSITTTRTVKKPTRRWYSRCTVGHGVTRGGMFLFVCCCFIVLCYYPLLVRQHSRVTVALCWEERNMLTKTINFICVGYSCNRTLKIAVWFGGNGPLLHQNRSSLMSHKKGIIFF